MMFPGLSKMPLDLGVAQSARINGIGFLESWECWEFNAVEDWGVSLAL